MSVLMNKDKLTEMMVFVGDNKIRVTQADQETFYSALNQVGEVTASLFSRVAQVVKRFGWPSCPSGQKFMRTYGYEPEIEAAISTYETTEHIYTAAADTATVVLGVHDSLQQEVRSVGKEVKDLKDAVQEALKLKGSDSGSPNDVVVVPDSFVHALNAWTRTHTHDGTPNWSQTKFRTGIRAILSEYYLAGKGLPTKGRPFFFTPQSYESVARLYIVYMKANADLDKLNIQTYSGSGTLGDLRKFAK